jgi:CheY-like chemotaxis protein
MPLTEGEKMRVLESEVQGWDVAPIAGVPTLRGRILLAEDGADNQRLLNMYLSTAGSQVTIAENGQVAVQMAMSQPFDLILMDMRMPVMDGYTATTELRRHGFNVPIVALTAQVLPEDRIKCIESGCSDYLGKPFTEEALLRTVAHHLGYVIPAWAWRNEEPEVSRTDDNSGTIFSTLIHYPGMKAVIDKFVEGLSADVATLLDMANCGDWISLRRLAHQLRGAGGGFGFDAITTYAGELEDSIKDGDPPASISAHIHSLIDVIRRSDGFGKSGPGITSRSNAS